MIELACESLDRFVLATSDAYDWESWLTVADSIAHS